MRTRRRFGATLSTVALVASLAVVALPATTAFAGTQTNTNACVNNVTGTYSDLGVTLSGSDSPDPATLGVDTVTLSGLSLGIDVPGDLLIAGYNLGLLTTGVNTIPATVNATIVGTNTAEGSQSETVSVSGTTTITDPDGAPGTGDESATPLSVSAPLANQTWTPNGGDIDFKDGGSITSALIAGGLLTVTFNCTPGVSVDNDGDGDNETFTPVDPTPFETTTVVAPPAPPDAVDDSAAVGASQSVFIDVLANDSDQNGDLDPGSLAVPGVTGTPVSPSEGTAVVSSDGPDLTPGTGDDTPGIVYTNTNAAASADSFTYEVDDLAGLGPSQATVNVTILGNVCDATTGPCTLDQVIDLDVIGTTLTMEQAGQFVTLGAVTLNGEYQVTNGAIQPITVTNARGTDAMWDLTGQVTDFVEGTSGLADCSTPSNRCIPGDNLGWAPSASIAHTPIPGDVAAVAPGASLSDTAQPWLDGLSSTARDLCTTAATTSGGTFLCEANLYLAVPASAAAGNYEGTMTFTLA